VSQTLTILRLARPHRARVLLIGAAAAAALLLVPPRLLDIAVASIGLSEHLSLLAPPLGIVPRLGLALFAAQFAMWIALLFTPKEPAMAHALPSPFDWTRLLRRRRAPEAPREPLVASRDLPTLDHLPPARPTLPTRPLPRSPEPLSLDEIHRMTAGAPRPASPSGAEMLQALLDAQPTLELGLAELADRFEAGLAARRAAPAPFAAAIPPARVEPDVPPPVLAALPPLPPEPVRAAVESDVEGALQAALGHLKRIARAG
jgi:hypothetical protein